MRISWIDRAKGILILFVILGHVVGSASNASDGMLKDLYGSVFKSIYLFHMPAFFMLAGLTLTKFDVKKKFFRLLIPYFSFGVISIFVFVLCARGVEYRWWHPWASLLYGATFPGTDGFRCNSVLWFLPCLFATTWIASFLWKIELRWPRWGLAFLIGVATFSILGFVAYNRVLGMPLPYGLNLVIKYLPFVIVGHYLPRMISTKMNWLGLLALACYLLALPFAPFDWDMYTTYWKWGGTVLMGGLGCLGCFVLSNLMPCKLLTRIGEVSIGMMMVHKWFVLGLNQVGCRNVIIVFVGVCVVSYGLSMAMKRFAPWLLGERRI